MADNVTIDGVTYATDETSGVHRQRVKLQFGVDGVATDVSATDPLPVTAAALPLPTGAATAAQIGEVQASPTANTVLDRLKAIATALAGTLGITGTVAVSNFPATQPVSAAALPLPTGAASETSVAAAATSLAIIDDWDETDRAKVNLIVGQAGIAAGAGASGATVPRVTLASDSPGVASLTSVARSTEGDYETVAASQTNQVLGPTGATGDYISHILVIPATTSPGAVTLLDNATSITVFTGGASSVTNLVPFIIPLNMVSVSGSWRITTGANVSCVGVGSFT